jgi:putative SOS response-associated peptidase YedK
MCGRFSMAYEDWSAVLEYFGVIDNGFRYPPRYNIAPTQQVPAIISDGKQRRIGLLKWGLVPYWSETEKTSFSTINARAETLLVAPSFRHLVSRKRCIIPADGFYEWHRHTKKPYRIRLKKREVFGFAGLYDIWRSPDGKRKVSTFTIITCKPNMFMAPLHDRMPVILTREAEDIWLDRSITDTDTLMSVLQPYPDGEMYAYRVPELVGNVRNDGPECIEVVT